MSDHASGYLDVNAILNTRVSRTIHSSGRVRRMLWEIPSTPAALFGFNRRTQVSTSTGEIGSSSTGI